MAEPIKFSELTNAGTLDLSAIMAIVQQQGGELVSLQCSMAQVAELVASSAVYADLTTEQKKLIDAINELNAGKQKKLIAGANITINEETGEISSTGGGGGGGDVTKAYVDEQNALQDAEIEKAERDIDLLYKLTQGQSWDFVDQTEYGMNVAPKGTKVQSLLSVEGKIEQETTTGAQISRKYTLSTSSSGAINLNSGTLGTVETGKTYTLSFMNNTNKTTSTALRILSDSQVGQKSFPLIPNALTTVNFTATVSGELLLNVSLGEEYASMEAFTSIMLVEGDTAHDFEPYTGGIPSPNPDYPQEITSVEELNFKRSWGKNLMPIVTTDNIVVMQNSSGTQRCGLLFKFNKKCVAKANNPNGLAYLSTYDPDTNSVGSSSVLTTERSLIAGRWYAVISNSAQIESSITRINEALVQIEYGDEATDYEPYHSEEYSITPPFALNKIGDNADLADVERGVWVKTFNKITIGSLKWVNSTSTPYNFYADLFDASKITKRLIVSDRFIGRDVQYNVVNNNEITLYQDYQERYPNEQWVYIRKDGLTREEFIALMKEINPVLVYPLAQTTETAINADDLQFLKSLQNLDEDNVITITDQNGNDITYAMKYLIKLSEAI